MENMNLETFNGEMTNLLNRGAISPLCRDTTFFVKENATTVAEAFAKEASSKSSRFDVAEVCNLENPDWIACISDLAEYSTSNELGENAFSGTMNLIFLTLEGSSDNVKHVDKLEGIFNRHKLNGKYMRANTALIVLTNNESFVKQWEQYCDTYKVVE